MFTAPKASTTARGYGAQHQAERARRLPLYTPASPCGECKRPLGNNRKQWHLPHNAQRTGYLPGFWCADCNRKDGARRAKAKQVRLAQAVQAMGGRCPICGNAIAIGRIYCSQRCGWVAHKDQPPKPKAVRKAKPVPEPRICVLCGEPVPKGRRRLCSDACMTEHNARLSRERYRVEQGLPSTWDQPRTAHRW